MEDSSAVGISSRTLSKEDFDEICRCCLSSEPIGSIFELIYEETPLVDVFYNVLGTQLDAEDNLPKKICKTCIGDLIHCYNFKKSYEASETVLLKIATIKVEDVDSDIKSEVPEQSFNAFVEIEPADVDKNEEVNNTEEYAEQNVNTESQKQPDTIITCSREKTFSSKLEFHQHRQLTNHRAPPSFLCDICGKLISKRSQLYHAKTHEAVKPYSCDHCVMRFISISNLKRHMMMHTGERPHVCNICGQSFRQLKTLKLHSEIHSDEKPYLCATCGKGFRHKTTYDIHRRNHNRSASNTTKNTTNTKPQTKQFVCRQCGRVCLSKTSYKLHVYKHDLGEGQVIEGDQYQCKICKRFYASQSSLRGHTIRMHNEKKFLCSECGKQFRSSNALKAHSSSHTGEKSFNCEFCNKKFAHQQSLQTHRFTHTGEKPYPCTLCPKKFRRSLHLTTHMKVHTGERPYVCKICNKTFPLKYTLNQHVQVHTRKKLYKCDECVDTFWNPVSLKRHKELKHPIVIVIRSSD